LADNRLSHLSAAQIGEITVLTQIALTKHWVEGVALENTARKFKDFPPSITSDELSQVRNRKNVQSARRFSFDKSISRFPILSNGSYSPMWNWRFEEFSTLHLVGASSRGRT